MLREHVPSIYDWFTRCACFPARCFFEGPVPHPGLLRVWDPGGRLSHRGAGAGRQRHFPGHGRVPGAVDHGRRWSAGNADARLRRRRAICDRVTHRGKPPSTCTVPVSLVDRSWRSVASLQRAPALTHGKLKQRASRLTPNTNESCPFQTHQQSPRGHRVPLLAATKRWHLPSIQFPRHRIVAHMPRRPNFSNDRRQGPRAQVSRHHVRQSTWRSTLGRETWFAKDGQHWVAEGISISTVPQLRPRSGMAKKGHLARKNAASGRAF